MTPREFVRFLDLGRWQDLDPGSLLVQRGSALEQRTLIAHGVLVVEIEGEPVSQLDAGQFVGEICYLTGQPASADVRAGSSCRCIQWLCEALRAFLHDNPSIRAALQDILGKDLATKLRVEPAPRVHRPVLEPT